MTTSAKTKKPYVVHGAQDASTTIQTRGMVRQPGITSDTAGASRIWLAVVTAAPLMKKALLTIMEKPRLPLTSSAAGCGSTLGRISRSM